MDIPHLVGVYATKEVATKILLKHLDEHPGQPVSREFREEDNKYGIGDLVLDENGNLIKNHKGSVWVVRTNAYWPE